MGPLRLAPLGFQTIDATTLETATGLTVPDGANAAVISVDGSGAGVNWRDDGTDPTDTVGITILATAPVPYEYYGRLNAIKFIAQSGTPTLNVSYYKIAG